MKPQIPEISGYYIPKERNIYILPILYYRIGEPNRIGDSPNQMRGVEKCYQKRSDQDGYSKDMENASLSQNIGMGWLPLNISESKVAKKNVKKSMMVSMTDGFATDTQR